MTGTRFWTPQKKRAMADLLAEGKSYSAIAEIFTKRYKRVMRRIDINSAAWRFANVKTKYRPDKTPRRIKPPIEAVAIFIDPPAKGCPVIWATRGGRDLVCGAAPMPGEKLCFGHSRTRRLMHGAHAVAVAGAEIKRRNA